MDVRRSPHQLASTIFAALLSVVSCHSYADSFDTFGDQDKLQGQEVLAAGNISDFSGLQFSQADPSGPENERFYRVANFCFGFGDNLTSGLGGAFGDGISGNAALLLIDKFKNVSLAEFTASISQTKVSIRSVSLYDCASLNNNYDETIMKTLQQQLQRSKDMMEILKEQQQ